ILPYEYRVSGALAQVPLGALRWPLGGARTTGTVADLTEDDHLLIYPRTRCFFDPRVGVRARISLLIAEPFAVHRKKYLAALALHWRFWRIITHRPALARRADNALLMPFGGSWVAADQPAAPPKTAHMSLIASTKNTLEGHALRHRIADWCGQSGQEVDLLGHAYKPLDHKEDGLLPYRYSVVIENSQEAGYFTEKLVDCLLCGAMPIYWGAPDIDQYFDPEGLILCNSEEDIKRAIRRATNGVFEKSKDALARNRQRALGFADYEMNAAIRLAESCGERFQTSA
ncbi:MAG: hypothetical protein AAGC96_19110, partial [Pseudomonadota bacterium]